ncbi:hypothetical protein SAMN02745163_01103 [Clostridium cavendishii DSM 21758]|uniref:Uncharacterized protein n=1 Tax=Clostridium cavendishii DSM 21758 TaxID=1121302 RepID=A0A1M6FD25_9CLOT|nr:hypothetical protein [Clostridium cavendishii]SHI95572.1 hypothetical protein SAMN02745163_01103 [Clostridium cavendishii DSM 21758]
MIYSEKFLKSIIEGKPIGEIYPYKDGTKKQRELYIKSIVADLKKSNLIKVEADFNSYGSGYSSYVDIFCYKTDGSSILKRDNIICINGVTIYISKLAPLAIYGSSKKIRRSKGGSYDFLDINSINKIPSGDWDGVICLLKDKLNKYGIELLEKKELARSIDFEVQIPTISKNPNFNLVNSNLLIRM